MKKYALYIIPLLALTMPQMVSAQESLGKALSATKTILEVNTRYEGVSQQSITIKAEAITSRVRFGFQTGKFYNFSFLAELEAIGAIKENYNSTLNGKTNYPNVLDPDMGELNRLQLTYIPSKTTTLTLGRQRIILDDARFVGNVGWRQDEQTYDALRIDTKFGKLALTAAYIDNVNRIIGDKRNWKSDSYIFNASYPFSDTMKLTGFAYLLDFSDNLNVNVAAAAKASSTNTYGIRASGLKKIGEVKYSYIGQFAKQSDTGLNPAKVDLGEYMIEGAINYKFLTLKANYEVLEGNGIVGFVTPLGTNHAFQGFSDVFSGTGGNKTLANGIKDLTLTAGIAIPTKYQSKLFKNPMFNLAYHDFKTDNLGLNIGNEWDASFGFAITPKLSALIKYADYERSSSAMPASRTKSWLQLNYKY